MKNTKYRQWVRFEQRKAELYQAYLTGSMAIMTILWMLVR